MLDGHIEPTPVLQQDGVGVDPIVGRDGNGAGKGQKSRSKRDHCERRQGWLLDDVLLRVWLWRGRPRTDHDM